MAQPQPALLPQQSAGLSIHWHLPDSIKDMTPDQLRALTSGVAPPPSADAGAVQDGPPSGEAVYTLDDVAQHATREDCWIAVGDGVYDVTEFMEIHPGGIGMLKMVAGKDATQHFQEMHRPEILTTIGASYRIGTLQGGVPTEAQSAGAEAQAPLAGAADAAATAVYTLDDVAQHATREDCWIAVEGGVYDVTEFMEIHPGGIGMLKMVAGKDATQHFQEMHRPEILTTIGASYRIGTLASAVAALPAVPAVAASPAAPAVSDHGGGAGSGSVGSEDGLSTYTMEEVALHSSKEDCWVVVQGAVYDVTEFLPIHPGGGAILASQGGKDATDFFTELHRPQVLEEVGAQYKIGVLSDGGAAGGGGGGGQAVGGETGAAGGGSGAPAAAETASAAGHADRLYTMEEVHAAATGSPSPSSPSETGINRERPRESGLQAGAGVVVLHGGVYDFTPFLSQHPGGARAILRLSGTDATKIFTECHTPEIYRELVPAYRVGTVVSLPQPLSPPAALNSGSECGESLDPLGGIASPFPSERFDGTGLEAFRFQWAASDWLLRRDPVTGRQRPPTKEELWHVHRAKSHVSPLNYERDWLHVGHPPLYAADMALKEALLSNSRSRPLCYVSTPESLQAEQEVLDDVIAWCCNRYPDRFTATTESNGDGATVSVSTHTPGYERTFIVSE